MNTEQVLLDDKANKVGSFVKDLISSASSHGHDGNTLDSATANHVVGEMLSGREFNDAPQIISTLIGENEQAAGAIVKSIFDSVNKYTFDHGHEPNNDIIFQAIHSAYSTTNAAKAQYRLDSASATTDHHDQHSIQAARAIVAVVSTLSEAIPSYAYYLPADIGTNEARLSVVTNRAASDYGAYKRLGSLAGINAGDSYITSSRIDRPATTDQKDFSGKLTTLQGVGDDYDKCNPAGGSLALLRGRSIVYVNGRMVGGETDRTGSGDSSLSGRVTVGEDSIQFTGKINTDNGAYTLKFDQALPATYEVLVEGFIDYEMKPDLTPSIQTAAEVFSMFAKAWRVTTSQTIDSRTQMSNELGIDPYSHQVLAVNQQYAHERHYDVIRKAARLAAQNQTPMIFREDSADFFNNRVAVTRAITEASHKMAEQTLGFGISVLYVNQRIAALLPALPSDMFEPSGIQQRASVYRVGRLLGVYDVYYTPKGVPDNRMLCIGKAPDLARNPFVLGDAVPPTVVPLAVNIDLKTGAGFYARNFTSVNPYEPSNNGCAWINVNFI